MSVTSNDTYILVIAVAAFKIGATFGLPSPHSPGELKTIEPDFPLQQASARSNSRALATCAERRLPGRTETYSQIGANVFQIHCLSDRYHIERLAAAQSEDHRNDPDGRTPRGDGVEICAPQKLPARKHPLLLTYQPLESPDGA